MAVVGSGAAGFAAAIAARRRGARVVMVEAGTVGGTCVNTGCVPSKALLAAARARQVAVTAGRYPGIRAEAGPVAFGELVAGKDAVVEAMRADRYVALAAEHGWPIAAGSARFTATAGGPVLEVELDGGGTSRLEAGHYLVATGATAWIPPIPGLAEAGYLTSTTAMGLEVLPESMVVLGGNATGLELAQLFARLGTDVTVVESAGRLAPLEESEVSAAIEAAFAAEGIAVRTGATVSAVGRAGDRYRITVDGGQLSPQRLLVTTGRRPVTAGLGLAAVGVKTGSRGEVVVDDQLRTSNPRIWAAGDVTGHPQLVYVAAAHGSMVADNALAGAGRGVDYRQLPRVVFTSPAIGVAGLTEAEATAAGHTWASRVLPLTQLPRAVVDRDTGGLVKLVADARTGRVLGVHAVADAAGELAAAGAWLLTAGVTVDQLATGWAPYLTAAEALKLAAQTFTRDVATLSCCAA
jgi:mercuric reductase